MVMGVVTMSVAMKKAPRMRPPYTKWYHGAMKLAGLMRWQMPVKMNTVRRMVKGVTNSMTRRALR